MDSTLCFRKAATRSVPWPTGHKAWSASRKVGSTSCYWTCRCRYARGPITNTAKDTCYRYSRHYFHRLCPTDPLLAEATKILFKPFRLEDLLAAVNHVVTE